MFKKNVKKKFTYKGLPFWGKHTSKQELVKLCHQTLHLNMILFESKP